MIVSTILNKPTKLKKIIAAVLTVIFWLSIWQLAAVLINQQIVIASPVEVFFVLCRLCITAEFWQTVLFSVLRIFSGFLLGVLFGIIFAIITSAGKIFYMLFSPLMSIIKATPVASFIIMLMFFTENNFVPVIISFLMVFPIIWANVFKGISETDKKLLEMADVFELNIFARISDIYLPSVKSYFMPAVLTALGLSWKAGIAAEVLSTPQNSIGQMLYNAKVYLETPQMLAWTVTVIIISMILEALLSYLMKRLDRNSEVQDDNA